MSDSRRLLSAVLVLAGPVFSACVSGRFEAPSDIRSAQEEPADKAVDAYGDPLPPGALARCGTIRLRHGGDHCGVGFLRVDGREALLTASDKAVRLWSSDTGKLLKEFSKKGHWPSLLSLSTDESTLVTGGIDVCVWDMKSGLAKERFQEMGRVTSVTMSATARIVAWSTEYDYDVDHKAQKGDLVVANIAGHATVSRYTFENSVDSVALSPDGSKVAFSLADGRVIARETAGGKELLNLPPSYTSAWTTSFVFALSFSPDGQTLAIGGWGQPVRIIGLDGSEIASLEGDWQYVGCLSFSRDGRFLAVGSGQHDQGVYLWQLADGKRLWKGSHHDSVHGIAFSGDGRVIATGSADGTYGFWDAASGRRRRLGRDRGHEAGVGHLAFSRDGKILASAASDGNVRAWPARSWKSGVAMPGYGLGCFSFAISPSGRSLVIPSDKRILAYEVATGVVAKVIDYDGDHAQCAAFSNDGTLLAVGGTSGLDIYEVESWRMRKRVKTRGHVLQVAFVPGQNLIAYATGVHGDGLHLISTLTGVEVRRLPVDGYARDLTVSANGRVLAVLSPRGAVMYDVGAGTVIAKFAGPGSKGVARTEASIALSPDATQLALGCTGGDVMLWQIGSSRGATDIGNHDGFVDALAFSPDGTLLASGGADTSVLIWQVDCIAPRRQQE